MSEPGLEIRTDGALGRITLDKAKALHALDLPMCRGMTDSLTAWKRDPAVAAVLVDHKEGTRGFCAGGDVRLLWESGRTDGVAARAFFATEYKLNALIQSYPKPYIAVLDGITMGGGVGISVHGTYRIATENTNFAMPETGLGLFPDVGGSWFLSRLPGQVGTFLALTGARLKAADALAVGIATHYVPSADLPGLKDALASAAGRPDPARAIADLLKSASQDPGPAPLSAHRAAIDRLFGQDRIEDILFALAADGSDWAQAQAKTLISKSPQTLKVALRQVRIGRTLSSFAEVMKMEYRIASRVVVRHDFLEGVRATIIDKDGAPKWKPATVAEMADSEIDKIFAPLPANEELTV